MAVLSVPLASKAARTGLGLAALVGLLAYSRKAFAKKRRKSKSRWVKPGFFEKLKFLLQELLPGVFCKESIQMGILIALLLSRTAMSLFVAKNMGRGVEHTCNREWSKAIGNTVEFAVVTVLAAGINALLKYFSSSLEINLRRKFTTRVHEEYMKRNNYYRCTKLAPFKIELADQLICDDIHEWSAAFADVYSSVFKPSVDFFLFSWQLYKMAGYQGPVGMYLWFVIAGYLTIITLPPYGKLAAKEQQLEGEFRDAHARLIQNSEMVAFMRGEKPERFWLEKAFISIVNHRNLCDRWKLSSDLIMGYFTKYFASVVGFLLMIRPIWAGEGELKTADAGGIAKYYVAVRHVMENLANAVLALFEIQKKVGRLSGLTDRVYNLLTSLMMSDRVFEELTRLCPPNQPGSVQETNVGDELLFDGVDVYRPDGALLAKNLTFEVPHGRKVMITGSNGCGKSSLFRILRGLWPLIKGKIIKPEDKDLFFLSQVNFVPKGSLRELITYPHREECKGTDEELFQCMELAHLGQLEAQGVRPTMNTVMDWDVALSPGQKQRMAFARLFYHKPRYAVLDECTNGISPEVEEGR